MKEIKIQMFGAFRKYSPSGSYYLNVPADMNLEQFRLKFLEDLKSNCASFNEENLVFDSAFANAEEILSDEDIISDYDTLAVLPPVCGG